MAVVSAPSAQPTVVENLVMISRLKKKKKKTCQEKLLNRMHHIQLNARRDDTLGKRT